MDWLLLPKLNACLNFTVALLLISGFAAIRSKKVMLHKSCMASAFLLSICFLTSYIIYHLKTGSRPFEGFGPIRTVYFTILISHTILAATVPFLAGFTIYRAWKGDFERHKRVARWTLPIWFYVAVTGVVIYVMLYCLPLFAQENLVPAKGSEAIMQTVLEGKDLEVRIRKEVLNRTRNDKEAWEVFHIDITVPLLNRPDTDEDTVGRIADLIVQFLEVRSTERESFLWLGASNIRKVVPKGACTVAEGARVFEGELQFAQDAMPEDLWEAIEAYARVHTE